jgi:transcriptional regulator with GAF, ATPase, and Fis domain
VKLLRFLQEGEIRKVGETQTLTVDVRVIAATSRDLEKAVAQAYFGRSLLPLNVVPLHLPPLRERREDIALWYVTF